MVKKKKKIVKKMNLYGKSYKKTKNGKELPIAPVGRILNKSTYSSHKKASKESDSKNTHISESHYVNCPKSSHKRNKVSKTGYYCSKGSESLKKRKKGPDPRKCHD